MPQRPEHRFVVIFARTSLILGTLLFLLELSFNWDWTKYAIVMAALIGALLHLLLLLLLGLQLLILPKEREASALCFGLVLLNFGVALGFGGLFLGAFTF